MSERERRSRKVSKVSLVKLRIESVLGLGLARIDFVGFDDSLVLVVSNVRFQLASWGLGRVFWFFVIRIPEQRMAARCLDSAWSCSRQLGM